MATPVSRTGTPPNTASQPATPPETDELMRKTQEKATFCQKK